MENERELKPNPKGKAIASFLLGIISALLVFLESLDFLNKIRFPSFLEAMYVHISKYFFLPLFWIWWLFPLLGIILGKSGLKSTKKFLAILGIILSLCALGGYIFLLWLILVFARF